MFTNTWRLNNMLQNEQKMSDEIKQNIEKFLESSEDDNATYQNLWDPARSALRGKFVATGHYNKELKIST